MSCICSMLYVVSFTQDDDGDLNPAGPDEDNDDVEDRSLLGRNDDDDEDVMSTASSHRSVMSAAASS